MLERYFRHFLKQRGFSEVNDVLYSLGYCQGDGCSFTASLDLSEVKALLPFVYSEDHVRATDRVKNLISLRNRGKELEAEEDLTVTISQSGNYVHENTMSFDWETPWGDAEGSTDLYDDLVDRIEEYAKDTAKVMADVGYSIIEAFQQEEKCTWSFKTDRYLFQLIETNEEACNTLVSDYDEDFFISLVESLIAGKSKISGLKAQVFDLTAVDIGNVSVEEPLEVIHLGGVEYSPEDRSYGGCRCELVGQLISELRDSTKQTQRQAA